MVQLLDRKFDPAMLQTIEAFVNYEEGVGFFTFIGAGKNADVFKLNGTDIAVKKFYGDARDVNDHIPLSRLQGIDQFPKLYAYDAEKYMVMELVDGKTIYQIEGDENHLYKEYWNELQKAVEETRFRGLYTNDVHLNNIMIGYDGRLKIVDVGRFTFRPTTKDQLLMARSYSSRFSSPKRPWTGTRYIPNKGTWRPGGRSRS